MAILNALRLRREIMKVTLELLERYGACENGRNWLKKNAPDGIEVMDALQM